ncbi:MAG: asparagine synthase-related protein, partial [Sphingomonas sp.]|uniref:asparagine synthase-related protein n=1 Tax=Sphingomonas sp. TaxID=28214 RepID=UPI003F81F36A
ETLIYAAWQRWDEGALVRFDGDYAIAVRDPARGEMVLARDPVGQRPWFFAVEGGRVAVASMPRAVNALLGRRAVPDAARLIEHLMGRAPADGSSFFAGVLQVEPGEIVRIARNGAVARHHHWNPETHRARWRAGVDYPGRLRALLDDAVDSRCDGAIAAHLSAGIDSNAVTAAAARDGRAVDAFTAIPASPATTCPPDRLADESAIAALLAGQHPSIRHHVVRPDAHAVDLLDLAWNAFEQPMPNPANFGWVAAINDAARDLGHSVMLIGQFGNFAFSAPRATATGARAMLAALRRSPARPSPFLAARHCANATDDPPDPLRPFRRVNPGPHIHGTWRHWGIELRDPTAARRLVEFCLTAPARTLSEGGETRLLARRALAGLLPAATLSEPRRGYQAADWLPQLAARADRARDIIEGFARDGLAADLLDIAALRRAADALPDALPSPATEFTYRNHFLRALATGDFIARANRLA